MRNKSVFIKGLSHKPTHEMGLRDAIFGIKSDILYKKRDIGVLKNSILWLKNLKMLIQ